MSRHQSDQAEQARFDRELLLQTLPQITWYLVGASAAISLLLLS